MPSAVFWISIRCSPSRCVLRVISVHWVHPEFYLCGDVKICSFVRWCGQHLGCNLRCLRSLSGLSGQITLALFRSSVHDLRDNDHFRKKLYQFWRSLNQNRYACNSSVFLLPCDAIAWTYIWITAVGLLRRVLTPLLKDRAFAAGPPGSLATVSLFPSPRSPVPQASVPSERFYWNPRWLKIG